MISKIDSFAASSQIFLKQKLCIFVRFLPPLKIKAFALKRAHIYSGYPHFPALKRKMFRRN